MEENRQGKFISDRSGFAYPYEEGVREPGTNFFVHESESDGEFSSVSHPQNRPPKFRREQVPHKNARFDQEFTVSLYMSDGSGTILTADDGSAFII